MNAKSMLTRAALVTPTGRGAVSCIVVDGPHAVAAVESQFHSTSGRRLSEQPLDRILFGAWLPTREELVVVRRGESNVEVNCHGGAAASDAILAALAAAGCAIVTWQDLVADQEASPMKAAARIALAACSTERTAMIVLDQYKGALDNSIERVMRLFVAGDVATAIAELRELLSWGDFGRHLTCSWRVVIAGPPNVGKSTLINALVGYQRAIVFDQAGTTRDVVTVGTAIDGWPIELSDTAGIRSGGDRLEQTGAMRAVEALRSADLAVLVFDITQPWPAESERLVRKQRNALIVHNKCDLLGNDAALKPKPTDRPSGLLASAKTGLNLPALWERLVRELVPRVPPAGTAIPFTAEQTESILTALTRAEAGQYEQAKAILARLVAAERR
jgi:tRNA modification GTPase